jgi:uncharacterized membrane protein
VNVLLSLARTVALRPYVFLFLAGFLLLAVSAWGWRRTIVFVLLGFGLAWAAEASSVRTGFPFGNYVYFSGPTQERELWLAGVPIMCSLSFVFLTFSGLQTARLALAAVGRGTGGWWDRRWVEPTPARGQLAAVALLGGVLTTGLNVVIDPVSLHGEEWFLGRLYDYPQGGFYFGVPFSNFAGWLVVSWAIIGLFLLLDLFVLRRVWGEWRSHWGDALGGLALFAGVLAFNIVVAFAIGQAVLGVLGCLWAGLLLPVLTRLLGARRGESRAGLPAG